VLLEALELALAELEPELEPELELEHPAVPSRPAATTVAPSEVAVRRLKMFTKLFVCDPSDVRCSGVKRAGERFMARKWPISINLVNAPHSSRAGSVLTARPSDGAASSVDDVLQLLPVDIDALEAS
jgi:hypothetical protein